MKTPFTSSQFFDVFKNYNLAVFPMQYVFYAVGLLAIFFALKPNQGSNKIVSGVLSFFWLWMGVVYHLVFFSSVNPAAFLFGALFCLQGILFLTNGVFRDKLTFKVQPDGYGITGIFLIVFALFIYPLLGYIKGHVYPSSPTFGLPCPTTIFTFGLFLMSEKKCPVILLLIPFLWSVIGFSAAFQFGIVEDTGLLIAGIVSILLLLIRNRNLKYQLRNDLQYRK